MVIDTLFRLFQLFLDAFSHRGITTGVYTALVAIRDNPGIQQGVLADCMLIKRSNMTKLINYLEARELVERRASPSDSTFRACTGWTSCATPMAARI